MFQSGDNATQRLRADVVTADSAEADRGRRGTFHRHLPTHADREYPTTGSHLAPELTNCRCAMASSCPVASKKIGQVRWTMRSR